MIELAKRAAIAWGGAEYAPKLISHRENAVFSVRFKNGTKAALRLHRPGYNSFQEIKAELWWTSALADRGFSTPRPIANSDGQFLLELSENVIATVIEWVDGSPIGAAGEPLAGAESDQVELYKSLGALLGRLHSESDALKLPSDFQRRKWDVGGFLGDDPLWGRFWENPVLTLEAKSAVSAARKQARVDLEKFAESADFGLIHADALRENVFQNSAGLTLIDYDDAGFGFRLFDLAVAISQSRDDANLPQLQKAILAGYAEIRPLSDDDIRHFDLFTMLRCFASLGWAETRVAKDSPQMKIYANRAEKAARAYVDSR